MDTSATTGVVGLQGQQTTTGNDAYSKLDLGAFVKLLIAELQNQDPMSPMDNTQILQQVSQIKQIASDQKLTETLQSVQLGQNLATAGGLLGRTVSGLSDANQQITGSVDSVSIEDGVPSLHIGSDTLKLTNVSGIDS